ncbi:hypothetical protein Tco_0122731 [Tanacetum coccineum]
MNYEPDTISNQTNKNAGIKYNVDAVPTQQYILLPLLYDSPQSSKDAVANDAGKKTNEDPIKEDAKSGQGEATNTNSTNRLNTVSSLINTVSSSFTTMDPGREKVKRNEFESVFGQDKNANGNNIYKMFNHVNTLGSSCDNLGGLIPVNVVILLNDNLPTDSLMPDLEDTGIFSGAYDNKDVGAEADLNNLETTMNVSPIPTTRIHKDHPKNQIIGDINSATQIRRMTKISKEHAMIEAMQDELLHFSLQKVWKLVDLPKAWYETLSTYLLENRFRRGIIDKTLFIKKDKGDILLVQMSSMGELTFFLGLQVMQRDDGIFISQDKYVADILKKFDFSSVKKASTLIETNKALLKDEEDEDVDVHLYRSMIGSLMYLTASRPDIMFSIFACARFQVTPEVSHLHDVNKMFRYLKGQPKLGLWYPRDSPFDLEAFSDSDYVGASLDRKSTTGGCQVLGKRLISWQCKKQTIVANSTTKAEYVAATNCCGQVLWIQNQVLDYGFNFMNTKIYINNESTICILKNLVFHSKTKHIEIRHHFVRDSYAKRLIQVIKIHTDHNVANLLTKAFDVGRFQYLTASIGMLNP